MADQKITDLTELTTPGVNDWLPIVDTSGTPTTKKIKKSNLVTRFPVAAYQGSTATGAGDVNLYTVSIPANTLGTNKGIHLVCYAARTTGSGQITLKAKYGGTQLDSGAGSLSGPNIRMEVYLWNEGATNAQRASISKFSGSSTIAHYTGTAAIDSTADQNFTIDVDLGTDSDVVTLYWVDIEYLNTNP